MLNKSEINSKSDKTFDCFFGVDANYFEKFYCGLFEYRISTIICIVFMCVSLLASVSLFYGIIWFERFGSDHKQTLVNKLLTSTCWTLIVLAAMSWTDIFRYLIGPLPKYICFAQTVAKHSLKTQIILLLDAISISKYIFVFHLKNPMAVKDDFWSCFLNQTIILFSVIFNYVVFVLPGRMPTAFYTCSDTDLFPDVNLPQKPVGYFEVLSIFLLLCIKIKIYLFKAKKVNPKAGPILNSYRSSVVNPDLIADIGSSLIGVTLIGMMAILNGKVNNMNQLQLNLYPNYYFMVALQLFGPSVTSLCLSIMYYCRHSLLRNTVRRQIQEVVACSFWAG